MTDPQSLFSGLYGNPGGLRLELFGFAVFLMIAITATVKIARSPKSIHGEKSGKIFVTWFFCGLWIAILGGVAISSWMELKRARKLCQDISPIVSRAKIETPAAFQSPDHLDGPYLIYYCAHGKPDGAARRLAGVGGFGAPPADDGLPLGDDDHWKNFESGEDNAPPGRANDLRDPLDRARYLVIVSSFVDHSVTETVTLQKHIITHVPGLLGGSTTDRAVGPPHDEKSTTPYIAIKADIYEMDSGSHLYSKVIGPNAMGDKLIPELYAWLSSLYHK